MFYEEDEYLDDPIRLVDYEQTRFSCNSEDTIIIDDDEPYQIHFDEYISSYPKNISLLPQTFSSISRNIELLNECRPMQIKIVDCNQFPWYYKRKTACENVASDVEDDIIIINETLNVEDSNIVEENNVCPHFKTSDLVEKPDLNLTNINQQKYEIENQYNLYKKKVNNIDVDKNETLINTLISHKNVTERECNNSLYDSKTVTPEFNINKERQKFKAFASVIEKAFHTLKYPKISSLSKEGNNINRKNKEKEKDMLRKQDPLQESSELTAQTVMRTPNMTGSMTISGCRNSVDKEERTEQSRNKYCSKNEHLMNLENLDKHNYIAQYYNHLWVENNKKIISKKNKKANIEKNKLRNTEIIENCPEEIGNQTTDSNSTLLPSAENTPIRRNNQISCSCTKQMYSADRIIPHFHRSSACFENKLILGKRNASKTSYKILSENLDQLNSPSSQNELEIINAKQINVKEGMFNNVSSCRIPITRNNNHSATSVVEKITEINNNNYTKYTEKPLENPGTKHSMIVQSIPYSMNENSTVNQRLAVKSASNLYNDTILNEPYHKQHNSYDISTNENVDFVTKHPGSATIMAIQKDYFDKISSITDSLIQRNIPDSIPQHYYINPNVKHMSFLRPPKINPVCSALYNNNYYKQRSSLPNPVNSNSNKNQMFNNDSRYPYNHILPRQMVKPNLPPSQHSIISRPPPPYPHQLKPQTTSCVAVPINNNCTVNSTISRTLNNIYNSGFTSVENENAFNTKRNNEILNSQRKCDEIFTTTNKDPNQIISTKPSNNINTTRPIGKLQNDNPIMKTLLLREFRPPVRKSLSSTINHIIGPSSTPLNKLNNSPNLDKKEYSPPILPIPTYEKTIEVLAQMNVINMQSNLSQDTSLDQQTVKPRVIRNNKRNATDDISMSTSKISLQEYKKRGLEKGTAGKYDIL